MRRWHLDADCMRLITMTDRNRGRDGQPGRRVVRAGVQVPAEAVREGVLDLGDGVDCASPFLTLFLYTSAN